MNTLTPDDPRHGTNAGYIAHALGDKDYCEPCRTAHTRARKANRLRQINGRQRKIPAIGTTRRIQALLALGHEHSAIAAAAGITTKTTTQNLIRHPYQNVFADIAAKVAVAYDKLSMTVPEGWQADKQRTTAANAGYLPPLAWDDETIDDPKARPRLGSIAGRKKTDVDEAVVERALRFDFTPDHTLAEKFEITRRWTALGRSLGELERVSGWRPDRYVTREDGAA